MKQRRLSRSLTAKVGASALSIAAMLSLQGVGGASASVMNVAPTATTPIQHVVVIFGENVSFDHYFATYPNASNPGGEPTFTAGAGTPAVNGLQPNSANGNTDLLTTNPNSTTPPARLDRTTNGVLTCDQNHSYGPEQKAFDGGKMDAFLANVATGATSTSPEGQPCNPQVNLDYYDGNVVTAFWNYAQNFAMSDNSFGTTFGPSTPGAINVVSGDTGNVTKGVPNPATNSAIVPDGQGAYSDVGDTTPYYEDCTDASTAIALSGQNVGDQLNNAGLSWGWFEGGFKPTTASSVTGSDPNYVSPDSTAPTYEAGTTPAVCASSHPVGVAVGGTGQYGTKSDYIAHHDPFQYYASTANPHHLLETDLTKVGTDTQTYVSGVPQFNTANHQYDMSVFNQLLQALHDGTPGVSLPAVSYIKAPGYQDGHQGYSDPLDEQQFVTSEINQLEQTPDWSSTAVILAYDDSDGFYDHVDAATEGHALPGVPQNASQDGAAATAQGYDALTAPGQCGNPTTNPPLTNTAGQPEQGRCGLGPRLPFVVISPYARTNFVSHTMTDQSSVVKFIEENWGLPQIAGSAANQAGSIDDMFNFNQTPSPVLFLNGSTGEPESGPTPALPESPFPGALVALGIAVFAGGAFLQVRRRRSKAAHI